mgnify:CR=1 FL=1
MAEPDRYGPNGIALLRSNPLNNEIIPHIINARTADKNIDKSTFTGPNHIPVIVISRRSPKPSVCLLNKAAVSKNTKDKYPNPITAPQKDSLHNILVFKKIETNNPKNAETMSGNGIKPVL